MCICFLLVLVDVDPVFRLFEPGVMPLPPALLARLQKRGIVSGANNGADKNRDEEVIAEDYGGSGDESDNDSSSSSDEESEKPAIKSALKTSTVPIGITKSVAKRPMSPPRGPVEGCPNTSNPYHECSLYCKQKFGSKKDSETEVTGKPKKSVGFAADTKDDNFPRPEDEVEDKVPLPPFWIKVIDPASGYSYYWNREKDLVSWLHPLDEDAVITLPAAKLAEAVAQTKKAVVKTVEVADKPEKEDDDEEESEEDERSSHKPKSSSKRNPLRSHKSKRAKFDTEGELDPMDPAAYDETVPRGTWSTGLVQQGAKAADSTASGPLFQQRPYPSPGDVLRANRTDSPE